MREGEVTVTLYDGSDILKEWEQLSQKDLPEIHETIKSVKQSLNEYLTQLIGEEKNICSKEQAEQSVASEEDEEEEESKEDCISGFIKVTANDNEKSKGSKRRQMNYVNHSKKLKR